MNSNYISPLNFNKNIVLKSNLQRNNKPINTIENNDSKTLIYPKNYYFNQISFGKRVSANELIARIGEENFPSSEIAERLKEIGNSKDYTLYDVHREYYSDILNCQTLKEAKEKYPEFLGVIDAKDIDINSINTRYKLYKIYKGQIDGINIDDLSLTLLKKYYGQLITTQKKEQYWGISSTGLDNIFESLNIKKLDRKYAVIASTQKEENRSKASERFNKLWQNPEYRQKQLEIMDKRWQDDEYRQKMTEILSNRWKDDEFRRRYNEAMEKLWQDDEFRKKHSESMEKMWQDPEFRRKREQGIEKLWQDDDYRQTQSEKLLKQWQDPEFRQKQAEATEKLWQNPDFRQMQTEKAVKQWQDPEFRQMMTEKAVTQWQDEEYRQMQTEKAIKQWQDPEFRQMMTEKAVKQWQDPEFRQMMTEIAVTRWQDDEFRQKHSEAMEKLWQDDEYRQKMSEKFKKQLQDDEFRQKHSEAMEKLWQDAEFRQYMQIVGKAKTVAFDRHPEIRTMMQEVAKSFPRLGEIIKKKNRGIKLTESEIAYRSAYFKACEEMMSGYHKIIGEEQHKILVEWGVIEE